MEFLGTAPCRRRAAHSRPTQALVHIEHSDEQYKHGIDATHQNRIYAQGQARTQTGKNDGRQSPRRSGPSIDLGVLVVLASCPQHRRQHHHHSRPLPHLFTPPPPTTHHRHPPPP